MSWSGQLAYAIGLIASDGNLSSSTYRVGITSKDLEMIQLFQASLGVKNKVGRSARGGEKEKRYFYTAFKSRSFYTFLQGIGLSPAKSKVLQKVDVPTELFAHFLRGVFDGDGTFWSYWDKRWPNSYVFHIEIASASEAFLVWLRQCLSELYATRGHIKRGAGVYILRFSKGDSRLLAGYMYEANEGLYLIRKYQRIKAALDFDEELKQTISTPR